MPRRHAALVAALLLSSCGSHSHGAAAPASSPSPTPNNLCATVHGEWNAQAGRCTLTRDGANGVHVEVKAQYPVDLVDNPAAGTVLGSFVQKFFADHSQTQDGTGDATLGYSVLAHPPAIKTVVFQSDWYFSSMPHPVGQIDTFTFDLSQGKQLQLADLFCPGTDPLQAIPPIARPFVQQALVGAPFQVEQFEPNRPEGQLADNYQAWALDGGDLVLYMPATRGPGGVPPGFITPRIPLTKLSALLKEIGCSP